MSWPEAIFYSVLAICGAGVFGVLIFVAILSAGAQSRRSVSEDLPQFVSIKYDGPADKASDMADLLRDAKDGNPFDGIDFSDAAKKAAERNERYRKAKEGEA